MDVRVGLWRKWVLKNWCFWTMVLEKTLGSPLNWKEIQPVHPKGDQSWKNWRWSWNTNTLATWCKELTHLKRPWCWGRLRAGGEGDDRGWDHWMASPISGHGFGWTLGVDDGQEGLACCGSWGHKELDMTEQLNWTDPVQKVNYNFSSKAYVPTLYLYPQNTEEGGWTKWIDRLKHTVPLFSIFSDNK